MSKTEIAAISSAADSIVSSIPTLSRSQIDALLEPFPQESEGSPSLSTRAASEAPPSILTTMEWLSKKYSAILTTCTAENPTVLAAAKSILDAIPQKINPPAADKIMELIANEITAGRCNGFHIKLSQVLQQSGNNTAQLRNSAIAQRNASFGIETVALDPQIPLFEQILAAGGLSPITQSISRKTLFHAIGEEYQIALSLEENLDFLARNLGVTVFFLNSISEKPIETDSRGLFDEQFITTRKLFTNPRAGLTEQFITRFNTIREYSRMENADKLPMFYVSSGKLQEKVLILETITGNVFRVVSLPAQFTSDDLEQIGNDFAAESGNIAEILQRVCVPISAAKFLLEGQSRRVDTYNAILEEEILRECFDDRSTQFINMYRDSPPDKSAISTFIAALLRKILARLDESRESLSLSEYYGIVFDAYATVAGRDFVEPEKHISVYARLRSICQRLASGVTEIQQKADGDRVIIESALSKFFETTLIDDITEIFDIPLKVYFLRRFG
ncbi:MAG: hypothetical protein M0R33_14080 [Methylomonas sp.]|uniref:hypothetical protein n=1 Tax=Methylomonas sp. TaxID=418 RepID=UPI0025ED54F1|nr:hypothetical protein [Methylomonas sp.]MCK9607565.1 hypothetical protein [Methylomonas sp.]